MSAPGWAVMWRVELTKMAAQVRVRVVAGACVLAPVAFVAAEAVQSSVPADTLFGRWVHESGFAVSLVVLGFAGQWALPVVIGIVAGDACSEEHRLGTASLILTRSCSRGAVLAGKALAAMTYTVAVVGLLAVASLTAGLLAVGHQPLVGLSGTLLTPHAALLATVGAWASEVAPALAITAIALLVSVLSRNSWVGVLVPVVLVTVLNLVALLSALDPVRPFLPTTGSDAWHGLVRGDVYTDQIQRSIVVSAGWVAACLVAAGVVFRRQDVVA